MSRDGVIWYGDGDKKSAKWARRNFGSSTFSLLSFCCTPVEILTASGPEEKIAHGSGFFWLKDGVPYLVTNWHVVSGRNPFTLEHLDQEFRTTPQRIRYFGRDLDPANGDYVFGSRPTILNWGEKMIETLKTPPVIDGEPIDLWACPLLPGSTYGRGKVESNDKAKAATCYVNEALSGAPVVSVSGSECFILGYPLSNYEGMNFPIWKRGTISSETSLGVMRKPIFLIDAATSDAMSGSPVIRRTKLPTVKDGATGQFREQYVDQLIGIYAGRLQSKQLEKINIGYAWYAWLIEEVIDFYNHAFGADR